MPISILIWIHTNKFEETVAKVISLLTFTIIWCCFLAITGASVSVTTFSAPWQFWKIISSENEHRHTHCFTYRGTSFSCRLWVSPFLWSSTFSLFTNEYKCYCFARKYQVLANSKWCAIKIKGDNQESISYIPLGGGPWAETVATTSKTSANGVMVFDFTKKIMKIWKISLW